MLFMFLSKSKKKKKKNCHRTCLPEEVVTKTHQTNNNPDGEVFLFLSFFLSGSLVSWSCFLVSFQLKMSPVLFMSTAFGKTDQKENTCCFLVPHFFWFHFRLWAPSCWYNHSSFGDLGAPGLFFFFVVWPSLPGARFTSCWMPASLIAFSGST